MKRKFLSLTLVISFTSIFVGSIYNNAHTDPTGSPNARTGSPGDGGNTCAISGCHTGITVRSKSNIISSNIPTEGYTPGTRYTITATSNSSANRNTFGFQISPQTTTGTLVGTLAVSNSTQTQITGGGKYITHKQAGITGTSGVKSWSFNWTAPAAGAGAVTFYGCFNNANGDGSANGDSIFKTTYVVQEKLAMSVNYDQLSKLGISVFPNPIYNHIFIKNVKNISFDKVEIMDLNGKIVYQSEGLVDVDLQLEKVGIPSGIYFVKIYNQNELLGTTKVVKN